MVHLPYDCFLVEGSLIYRAAFACVFSLLCLAFGGGLVFGQGTDLATIRGIVTDTTGAIIPGAAVSVVDALTSSIRETRTNSQGNYEMFGLKPGTYRVTITAPGMSKYEIMDIVLNGSDTVSADAVLRVSAAQETVVVSLEAPAINTEDQTISQTIDNQAVIELPRDSRKCVYVPIPQSERDAKRCRWIFQIHRSAELRREQQLHPRRNRQPPLRALALTDHVLVESTIRLKKGTALRLRCDKGVSAENRIGAFAGQTKGAASGVQSSRRDCRDGYRPARRIARTVCRGIESCKRFGSTRAVGSVQIDCGARAFSLRQRGAARA